jgi:hypothetical protein
MRPRSAARGLGSRDVHHRHHHETHGQGRGRARDEAPLQLKSVPNGAGIRCREALQQRSLRAGSRFQPSCRRSCSGRIRQSVRRGSGGTILILRMRRGYVRQLTPGAASVGFRSAKDVHSQSQRRHASWSKRPREPSLRGLIACEADQYVALQEPTQCRELPTPSAMHSGGSTSVAN